MPSLWQCAYRAARPLTGLDALRASVTLLFWLILSSCVSQAGAHKALSPRVPGVPHIGALRAETEELFYHGFDNYMKYAFPEDELRPITCKPLTRDRDNPAHIEVNDVLGNYSLTLVDSLSTLAILASRPQDRESKSSDKALRLFQDGVKDLVELYGDGTAGPGGEGTRARGFDLDSKVQVFETAIRGVGGLLSAHLFAVGDLPIRGYNPDPGDAKAAREGVTQDTHVSGRGIRWKNGLLYNGQLLRLAYDLGERLIPAFWTSTGIPYPRVNLQRGIPFYANSPGNFDPEHGQCDTDRKAGAEITETCSAGAGSLVLEFTVLSRLTGDSRFEDLAKRAFWSIWTRRSDISLIGAGIDAETGIWQHSWTGIGAGIDSFFEYAMKSHILLSESSRSHESMSNFTRDPRQLFGSLSDGEHSPAMFLDTWEEAHSAIKRHVYRSANFQHPHYIQVDVATGAARAFWVDALSAYYPGLLALSGYVEEAIETHLVATALWTRFSALPERYNMVTGGIEGGLGWWVGRPEFIESNYYLYQATEDPWYIYVGEMVLRDIKRRCWTHCGWASLQNVLSGEQSDRMESFFLGETAKYLFLLFDPDHPLNTLDAPFVFSTEGHPLIIPKTLPRSTTKSATHTVVTNDLTCPAKEPALPLTLSRTAARGDIYHAGSLARLHLMPQPGQLDSILGEYATDHPSITTSDLQSPSNYTFYPWTLPLELIPANGTSSPMPVSPTFDLSFPTMQTQATQAPLQRVTDGVLVNLIGGLRLSMTQDVPVVVGNDLTIGYRIHAINNVALGKDERVYLAHDTGYGVLNPQDPHFTRIRDPMMLDVILDLRQKNTERDRADEEFTGGDFPEDMSIEIPGINGSNSGSVKAALQAIITQLSSLVGDKHATLIPFGRKQDAAEGSNFSERVRLAAIIPTGEGAAPIPDWSEVRLSAISQGGHEIRQELLWSSIFVADEMCDQRLPLDVARNFQIIVTKRGSCSFSKKLSNIPATAPSSTAVQLVIVVDHDTTNTKQPEFSDEFMDRPLLDEPQRTGSGLPRLHPIPMVMVGGGEATYEALRNAVGIGIKRRYSVSSQGIPIANLMIL